MTVTPIHGTGFAVTSMILGILALLLSFVPILNVGLWPLAILALVFGGIALGKKYAGHGMAISGLVTALASIVVFFLMYGGADAASAL
ncbi:hypothetical protein [Intrasporangium sp.]|uniref:hypothetical protein n=1 Tax=Intrasporangium sp. TaxID=1925024 RepID=UPI0033657C59